jgi:hypothetical protein
VIHDVRLGVALQHFALGEGVNAGPPHILRLPGSSAVISVVPFFVLIHFRRPTLHPHRRRTTRVIAVYTRCCPTILAVAALFLVVFFFIFIIAALILVVGVFIPERILENEAILRCILCTGAGSGRAIFGAIVSSSASLSLLDHSRLVSREHPL